MREEIRWLVDHTPIWLSASFVGLFFAWQIITLIARIRDNREEIACVAIKYDDIGILALPAPARHHHVMWARCFIDGRSSHPGRAAQGFLTTHGRFVDRVKGLKIATKRNQIVHKYGNPAELYSEDMWDTPPEARGYSISHTDD